MIGMKTAIYTALLTFLVISILLGSVGLLCGKWIMNLLQTPSDVLDLSVVYLNIYFLGLTISDLMYECVVRYVQCPWQIPDSTVFSGLFRQSSMWDWIFLW